MDATRLNQMVLQNSEDLDLTKLFARDDVSESASNRRPRNYTPFSIRDILGMDQPKDVQRSNTVTHESRVRSPRISTASNESSSEPDDSSDDCPSRQKTRSERRQAYSSYQVRELENVFTTTSYPGRKTTEQLAQLTELTPKQVRIWFQNRRQKYKNVARSGGRGWILRSAPRVLRSEHLSNSESHDLSARSNQFLNNLSSVMPSQHQHTNHTDKRMLSRDTPVRSSALTSLKGPAARRVPKFHPYAVYRSVRPVICQSPADSCVAMAALMQQQKIFQCQ